MKREILQDLLVWKESKTRKPLLLKGVRQVGKTYTLQTFGANHFPNYHYVNFEKSPNLLPLFEPDLDPTRILKELSFFLDTQIEHDNDLLIFDEIQACPKALTSLKYFHENYPKLALCGAGSLLGLHLGNSSFPVGKVTELNMSPMSFKEFLMALQEEKAIDFLNQWPNITSIPQILHDQLWEWLKIYFVVGGMPEAVTTYLEYQENPYQAFTEVRKRQNDLIMAYYADMAKHAGKANAMHIDRVFKSVCYQLANMQDSSTKKFKFKGVVPGISHYQRLASAIDWLIATGLVIKVSLVNSGNLPFKGYMKESAFKLFMFDVGILGAMSGLPSKTIIDYNYGSYQGYFAENFVAQALIYAGVSELFSWSEKNSELEFLLELCGNVVPLEVKSGKIIKAKSLKIFSDKYHPKHSIILSANTLRKDTSPYRIPLYFAELLTLRARS